MHEYELGFFWFLTLQSTVVSNLIKPVAFVAPTHGLMGNKSLLEWDPASVEANSRHNLTFDVMRVNLASREFLYIVVVLQNCNWSLTF